MEGDAVRSAAVPRLSALVAITLSCYLAVEWVVEEAIGGLEGRAEVLSEAVSLAVLSAALVWLLVIGPWARCEHAAAIAREDTLRHQAGLQDFDARFHRALEMASTEQACYDVVQRSVTVAAPRLAAELLLADSSEAHLKAVVAVGPDGVAPGCTVGSPHECPAVRRAQTLTFSSSEEIDACPYLRGRPGGACSATCVPVSVGGRSIGVLHTVASDGEPSGQDEVRVLESLADQSGSRIGLLRVMAKTHLQAATDPLTGLLNRRSLENQAHDLLRRGIPFAVAMADLDHFKALNDRHGHDAGDRALRLFARTLQRAVRGDDLVARFGGEEFVILFPERNAEEAGVALERVQEELLVALAAGSVPGFTSSFGVADTTDGVVLEELLEAADRALFAAKHQGRDRVLLARAGRGD